MQVKLRNLVRFLSGGDKAKVTLRGREMAHRELGAKLLDRVATTWPNSVRWSSSRRWKRQMTMVIGRRRSEQDAAASRERRLGCESRPGLKGEMKCRS